MQDVRSIGGGGDRFFSGGGELRLRPHHHQQNHHLTLKCPRCDSLHTKFCYFNNYNLSQPRHYCKSCRRYWTKGGVLRNVPVGGGCRKSKRSKPKTTASDSPPDRKRNSHSSSESSSLTASTTAATSSTMATAAAAMAATTAAITTDVASSDPTLRKFPDSKLFNIPQTPNQSLDPPPLIDQPSDGGIFPEFGSFTSMMTFCQDPSLLGFNVPGDSSPAYRLLDQNNGTVLQIQSSNQHTTASGGTDALKMKEIAAGFQNQTVQVDLPGLVNQKTNNGGLGALDWQAGDDQFLYDLTGPVDQTYWNQTQWIDDEHPLQLR